VPQQPVGQPVPAPATQPPGSGSLLPQTVGGNSLSNAYGEAEPLSTLAGGQSLSGVATGTPAPATPQAFKPSQTDSTAPAATTPPTSTATPPVTVPPAAPAGQPPASQQQPAPAQQTGNKQHHRRQKKHRRNKNSRSPSTTRQRSTRLVRLKRQRLKTPQLQNTLNRCKLLATLICRCWSRPTKLQ
jgi:predicted lipid-binding transport protein (Tim44 family)